MNPSEKIDKMIAALKDWRGKTLTDIRKTVHEADPEIVEEWKWMGTPTWSHDGIVLIANPHKDKVKVTFFQGASLPDPHKLFNAGLEGNQWRAIDLREADRIDERALKEMVRAGVAHNRAKLRKKAPAKTKVARAKTRKK